MPTTNPATPAIGGRKQRGPLRLIPIAGLVLAAWGAKAWIFAEHCSIRAGVSDSFYAISPDRSEILISGNRRCTRGPLLPDPSGWSGVSARRCLIPGTCRVSTEPWYWHVDVAHGRVTGFSLPPTQADDFLCRHWPFAGRQGSAYLFTLPRTLPDGGTVAEDPALVPAQFRPCALYTRQTDGSVSTRQQAFGNDQFSRGLPEGWRYEYTDRSILHLGSSGIWLEIGEPENNEDRQGMPILHGGPARVSPTGS